MSTGYGQTVTLNDIALPKDGTYRLHIRAPQDNSSRTGNYTATVWDVTADVSAITFNQLAVGKIETPYSVDRWTFAANKDQQIRFDLLNTSSNGVAFDLKGPGTWSIFSNIANDSDLITLPASGMYTLTAHGTGGQYGASYSFKLLETIQSSLTLVTPYDGHFVSDGQAQLFKLEDRKSTRLNSSHIPLSRMPSSA